MMLLPIMTDFLSNIFLFLTLNLYLKSYAICIEEDKKKKYFSMFFLFWTILSLFPSIPYFTVVSLLLDYLFALFITSGTLVKRTICFVKYELFQYACFISISVVHTLLTQDSSIFANNEKYAEYISITISFLTYIFLAMYIILKQLSAYPTGRTYKHYFLSITSVIVILLVTCSMFLGSTIISLEDLVPLFFSLLLVITLLCLSIYQKVISVLEENMRTRIDAEKNALQLEYAANVEDSLNKLSTLRHDFKNHLIILQGYASSDRKDELLDYMQKLTDEFSTASDLIKTPSKTLSALLNAKKMECDRAGVVFHYEGDFRTLTISDYQLVTILGNLLDNALTAAAKCDDGFIELKMLTRASYLEIDCVNNHQELIKMHRDIYITTKTTRPELHGLGLRSVRSVVTEMNGELEISHTDDRFHVNILVPNYEQGSL